MTSKENTYHVKKWDWLRRSIIILLLLCSFSSELNGQTTLLSPTGDGGFETGPTFAGNNWTVVNAASNFWEVGAVASAYADSRGAYIVSAAGTYSYTTTTSRTSHMYRDIAIPSCASNTTLSFYWKGKGESGWDRLLVYTAPTTVTPVANAPASSSTTLAGATLVWTQPSLTATYTLATVSLPAALSGTTVRIIFTWQNDASGGTTPGAAVDNISLIHYSTPLITTPTSASVTTNSASLGGNITSIGCSNVTERGIFWSTTNGFADGAGTKVSELPGPYSTGTFTEAVTGLSSSTIYYYKAFATNSSGTVYTTQATFTTACANQTLTYSQGFNASSMPNCWSQQYVTAPNLAFTYPATSAGIPIVSQQEGTNQVMFNSYNNSGSQTRLVSLGITTTGTSSVDVEFQWYFSNNGGAGSYLTEGVQIQYSTNGTTWTNAGAFIRRYGATSGWSLLAVTLPAGAGNQPVIYVGFLFTSNAGYDSYLDAAVVKPTPACNVPTSVTSSAITSSTATISWTASTTLPSNGYQYEIRTSGAALSGPTGLFVSGTTVAGVVSANITGLAASTNYYVYVRSDCGGTYSTWTSSYNFKTIAINDNCATATSLNPDDICGSGSQVSSTIDGSTNSGTAGCSGTADDDVWFSFIAEANSQYVTIGNTGGSDLVTQFFTGTCGSLMSAGCYDTDPNHQVFSGLTIGSTYYVRVYSYGSSVITESSAAFTICIQNPPIPAADLCVSAITVSVGSSCQPIIYDNTGATETAGATSPGCGGTIYKDVWFKFTVPASGRVLITTTEITLYDFGMAIYSGTCGSLNLLECHYYPFSMPEINYVGLTPGNTIYIRFWHKDGVSTGVFGLCVKEDVAPPPYVANPVAGNGCSNAPLINNLTGYYGNLTGYTADNPGNMTSVFCGTVENNAWLKFVATGVNLSLNAYISSCQEKGGVQIQIYKTSDCINFTSVSNCFFPTSMTDGVLTASGLTVSETYYLMIDGDGGDICNYAFGASFAVVLAVEMENFKVTCDDQTVKISWNTKTETNNDSFTLERSQDVKTWIEVGQINGAGNSTFLNSYSFIDHNPDPETNYYRLKQTNFDGETFYSEVIAIRSCKTSKDDLAVYPNPFTNELFIDVSKIHSTPIDIQIEDVLGKIVYNSNELVSKNGVIILSLDPLIQKGYYTIKINYSDKSFEEHIIKN